MKDQVVLSIGEAMVELSQAEEPDCWRLGIAGDSLNFAWYLRRLLPDNWDVAYCSRVGMGEFSRRMLDFLAAEGIDATRVSRDARREIALYAISLQAGERSFTYWRDNSAAKGLADDPDALAAALKDVQVAYISGITLAVLPEAGRDTLVDALKTARRRGTQVVFDPNLRPRLWPDSPTMRREIEATASIADLVLPSFDDEREHFGDADPQATVTRYLKCGAGQVVVKAGGDAIRFGGSEGEGLVTELTREQPIDTTAAGDSFNAGYLAARLHGTDIPTAIRQAHELSRRVIRHRGALVRQALVQSR